MYYAYNAFINYCCYLLLVIFNYNIFFLYQRSNALLFWQSNFMKVTYYILDTHLQKVTLSCNTSHYFTPLTLHTVTIHSWFFCTKWCLIAHHYQLIAVEGGRCTRALPAWGNLWGQFCVKHSIYQHQARLLTCFYRLVQLIQK